MRCYISAETEVLLRELVKKAKWKITQENDNPDYVLLFPRAKIIQFLNKRKQMWKTELTNLIPLDSVIETLGHVKITIPKVEFEVVGPQCRFDELPTGPCLKGDQIVIKVHMNGWADNLEDAAVFLMQNWGAPQHQYPNELCYPLKLKVTQ